jgi:hypothetical protein
MTKVKEEVMLWAQAGAIWVYEIPQHGTSIYTKYVYCNPPPRRIVNNSI